MMGDFNIDLLNSDSHLNTDEFLNILPLYLFNPHILQPTHITGHLETLIDNIFFNSITHHAVSRNIVYDLSDHLPNLFIINKFSSLPKNTKIVKRDYSLFDENKLLRDFQNIKWESELPINGAPNVLFDTFYSKISSVMIHMYP